MKALLIGGGGRENAIAISAVLSNITLYSISHNLNPGIMGLSKRHYRIEENNKEQILKVAYRVKPDVVFIGPEDPLSNGVSDLLISQKFQVFAPSSKAAKLETSKAFLRQFMSLHNIDGNVESYTFTNFEDTKKHIENIDYKFVIKPDGLTGGKGVLVQDEHFRKKDEAIEIVARLFKNGVNKLLIERKLIGEEFSLQGFAKDDKIVFLPIVQDYKRAGENDTGSNTGGMGSISFSEEGLPFIPKDHVEKAKSIMKVIVEKMYNESEPYVGPIYGQFMSTADGPKLIEINARFGDPEAINVLDLLDDSIFDVAINMMDNNVPGLHIKDLINVVRYIVPVGYGSDPRPSVLSINEQELRKKGLKIYYASVDKKSGKLYQTRSRSLALLARGKSLDEINEQFNDFEKFIQGDYFYRRDIGTFGTVDQKIKRMTEILGKKFIES